MSQMFVRGIAELAEAYVSVKRLEKFLQCDEIDSVSDEGTTGENVAISVRNLRATWISDDKDSKSEEAEGASEKENLLSQRYTLDRINLSVKKGSLIGIVGPVGSGSPSKVVMLSNLLTEFHL